MIDCNSNMSQSEDNYRTDNLAEILQDAVGGHHG
jgi:hypothetical protein